MTRLPDLEAEEKRRILEDAGKVGQNRKINIDSYLASIVGTRKNKTKSDLGQIASGAGSATKEPMADRSSTAL